MLMLSSVYPLELRDFLGNFRFQSAAREQIDLTLAWPVRPQIDKRPWAVEMDKATRDFGF